MDTVTRALPKAYAYLRQLSIHPSPLKEKATHEKKWTMEKFEDTKCVSESINQFNEQMKKEAKKNNGPHNTTRKHID